MLFGKPVRRGNLTETGCGCLAVLVIGFVILAFIGSRAGNSGSDPQPNYTPLIITQRPSIPTDIWASRLDRLNPEEAGCCLMFGSVYSKASEAAKTYYVASQEAMTYMQLGDSSKQGVADSAKSASLNDLSSLSAQWLPVMEKVLPPASMEGFHRRLILLLKSTKEGQAAPDFPDNCLAFHKTFTTFDNDVTNRPQPQQPGAQWDIFFSPRFTPLEFNLRTGEVNFEIGFSTPVGDFSASPVKFDGVERLVIKFGEFERHLKLDRAFNIHMPKGCGLRQVQNNPTDRFLMIEIDYN
jgi:hypothetical protein